MRNGRHEEKIFDSSSTVAYAVTLETFSQIFDSIIGDHTVLEIERFQCLDRMNDGNCTNTEGEVFLLTRFRLRTFAKSRTPFSPILVVHKFSAVSVYNEEYTRKQSIV